MQRATTGPPTWVTTRCVGPVSRTALSGLSTAQGFSQGAAVDSQEPATTTAGSLAANVTGMPLSTDVPESGSSAS
ncbi:MAG: hypothetical protein JWM34_4887 [Ilumatobacteraceae bacterium]|nr:hypothetical protein [Ilumatobacteraceae bacterium]